MNQAAAKTGLPPGSTFTVVDRQGVIVARHPNPETWVGTTAPEAAIVEAIRARAEGVSEALGADGTRRLFAFTPFGSVAGAGAVYLSIGIPKEAAFAEADRMLARNLLGLTVVAGLALMAAWAGSDLFILRRVNALLRATERLGAGDLQARTGLPYGTGELSRLARAFDGMAEAIGRRQRELGILYALDRGLAQAHRPEDIARVAAEHTLPLLGFDAAAAYLLDERAEVLRLFHARNLPPTVLAEVETMPVGAGVAGRAVSERRPVAVLVDAYPEDVVLRGAAAIREAGFRTLVATPFLAHGHVYGALTLESRQPIELSDPTLALLASVGIQIGVACSYAVERERLTAQERLAALGRLAAGVAHELKNPVTVFAGRVELLELQIAEGTVPRSERLSNHLARLEEAVERMKRIMDGLSTYAKPPKPEPQCLGIATLLAATQELVAYQARKSAVTVSVDASPALPAVLGDRSQLMQVFLNLATNAIEAMAGGGGALTLRARAREAAADSEHRNVVVVEIADTGPGIRADELPKIWEPFYTTKPEGTGLGLSIVRSLVAEQPGASIEVHSRPGNGTIFTLTFPAAPASARPTER